MATPEGKVKARLKKVLAEIPQSYWFWPVQTGLGASTLDCLGCVNGQFIAIETKANGKHLTPRQAVVWDAIYKAGGTVLLVDDHSDMRGVREYIMTAGLLS